MQSLLLPCTGTALGSSSLSPSPASLYADVPLGTYRKTKGKPRISPPSLFRFCMHLHVSFYRRMMHSAAPGSNGCKLREYLHISTATYICMPIRTSVYTQINSRIFVVSRDCIQLSSACNTSKLWSGLQERRPASSLLLRPSVSFFLPVLLPST